MCHVYGNPKGLLSHVDDLLNAVEETADDDEIRRIIESLDYHVYEGDLNDPEYESKWNNIFEAIVSFVKLVRDRKDARYHKEELERKQEDLIEGDETMGQQSA